MARLRWSNPPRDMTHLQRPWSGDYSERDAEEDTLPFSRHTVEPIPWVCPLCFAFMGPQHMSREAVLPRFHEHMKAAHAKTLARQAAKSVGSGKSVSEPSVRPRNPLERCPLCGVTVVQSMMKSHTESRCSKRPRLALEDTATETPRRVPKRTANKGLYSTAIKITARDKERCDHGMTRMYCAACKDAEHEKYAPRRQTSSQKRPSMGSRQRKAGGVKR